MKTVEQLQQEREFVRGLLSNVFNGPHCELVKNYLENLLETDKLMGATPVQTYYNLGKFDALNKIMKEGLIHDE